MGMGMGEGQGDRDSDALLNGCFPGCFLCGCLGGDHSLLCSKQRRLGCRRRAVAYRRRSRPADISGGGGGDRDRPIGTRWGGDRMSHRGAQLGPAEVALSRFITRKVDVESPLAALKPEWEWGGNAIGNGLGTGSRVNWGLRTCIRPPLLESSLLSKK
jgi:hypothetical protein